MSLSLEIENSHSHLELDHFKVILIIQGPIYKKFMIQQRSVSLYEASELVASEIIKQLTTTKFNKRG